MFDRAFEHQDGFVCERGFGRGDVEFVFDFADQLLKNILDRDDAGGGTELVDHDREVTPALFEFVQQFGEDFGLGDDQNIVHDLADLHARDARGDGLRRD